MSLIRQVDVWLLSLRGAFSRQKAFDWFVVIVWAFMLRGDFAGVTSIVRCWGLAPSEYYNLLHFFHSSAVQLVELCKSWAKLVRESGFQLRIASRPVYVADAIKVGRAGRRMPGVKLLHQ